MSILVKLVSDFVSSMALFFGALIVLIWLTHKGLLWMFRKEYRSFTTRPENLKRQILVIRKAHWDRKAWNYTRLASLTLLVLGGSMFYIIHQGRIGGLDAMLPIFFWWLIPSAVVLLMSQQFSSCCAAIALWYEDAAKSGRISPPPGVKGPPIEIRC